MKSFARLTLLLLVVIVLAGCSRSGMEAQVSGNVSLDGKGVGPGVVVFVPIAGQGNPAIGAIEPSGDYVLKTNREIGLATGKYKVSVSILDQPPVKPGERSMVEAKLMIPKKYVTAETSGLEFEIAPGSNTIDLTLSSK